MGHLAIFNADTRNSALPCVASSGTAALRRCSGALLAAAIPLLPDVFSAAPDVRRLLPAVLLVAAAQQPVAGVVFVLDGVLIGAGDQDYLALAGLAAAGVFAAGAALVIAQHGWPGRVVAGVQPVADGPFRDTHPARPVVAVAGHRGGPPLARGCSRPCSARAHPR